ncbi:MAG TPA: hypothetical protein VGR22_11120 [Thermomicrobiales bacterium]|nr:hypothetical protein [Thermomicrobiales bacterium]
MAVDVLEDLRQRLLPMLQAAALQYANRVPNGYPVVIDSPQTGAVGIEIDPSYALYFTQDADGVSARMYRRSPRTDNTASSGREKFGGAPYSDVRPLGAEVSDQTMRNLIAELMSWYNYQPGVLYITDD